MRLSLSKNQIQEIASYIEIADIKNFIEKNKDDFEYWQIHEELRNKPTNVIGVTIIAPLYNN